MKIPPFFHWVVEQYQAQPVLTVVVGLGVLILVLYLMRKAFKAFAAIILILIALILASYFIEGEDVARQRLEDGGRKVGEVLRETGVIGGEDEQPAESAEPGAGDGADGEAH
ncbi:MAG: hypothetical protein H8E31_10535 [Planctomycetes bacterium]|nr:hypothetical protein [Planctomycetota bacterium]